MPRAGFERFFMYFHPINFLEFFSGTFQRKSMCKLFLCLDALMVRLHHEFVPRR